MTALDPKTQQLLDLMARLPPLDFATLTAADLRARNSRGREVIAGPPPPIDIVREVTVAGAAGPLPARLYDTREGDERPALVFFHGGGFVTGDLESHDIVCRRLALEGAFRVIAVDYRLAPEHPFPAPIDDAIEAIRHISAHAREFGVDPARIAVGGDSAGGNLAAVAALHFARTGELNLRGQLLIYPVTVQGRATASRETFAEGYFLTSALMDWFHLQYLGEHFDAADPRISPLSAAVPPGLAPAYIFTAGFDPLKDEGRLYAEKLAEAGVATRYRDYGDQIHGFVSFPNFSGAAEASLRDAARAVAEFLA